MKQNHTEEGFAVSEYPRLSSIESLRARNGLILGTDLYEPMAGREDVYSPYEVPAFYIPSHDPKSIEQPSPLLLHQEEVMNMHAALLESELADRVSSSVLTFIKRSIHSRMVEQVGLNSIGFIHRLDKFNNLNDESCRAALDGTATVAQAAEARAVFGMASAPIAEITVIGDKRTEYLPDMYDEVSRFVGHDVSKVKPYRMQVVGFDRDPNPEKTHHLGAMRVMMKRHFGTMSDGTEVKQRTLAIIHMSENSGIDSEITSQIFDAFAEKKEAIQRKKLAKVSLYADDEAFIQHLRNPSIKSVIQDNEEIDYAALPAVRKMLDALVARDMASHVVLARNETVYVYNKEDDRRIREGSPRSVFGAIYQE